MENLMGAVGPDAGMAGLAALVVTLAGLFIRNMLQDRGAGYTLAARADAQVAERDRQLAERDKRIDALVEAVSEQRTLKHKALNDLTAAQITIDTIRRLARECSCGALDPIGHLLDRDLGDG